MGEILGIVLAFILGTIFMVIINSVFDIWYLGFGAIITQWFLCAIIAHCIILSLGGILTSILGIVWFLIKIGFIVFLISFIFKKICKK